MSAISKPQVKDLLSHEIMPFAANMDRPRDCHPG